MIDCAPSLDQLSSNSLTAADRVVVVAHPHGDVWRVVLLKGSRLHRGLASLHRARRHECAYGKRVGVR
nr:hypothetical protein [Frigoribacterium sp. VKM Ac-2836]